MTMANEPSDASNAGRVGREDNVLAQARLALENGRPEDAERIAAEMLKADPHHADALHILGCALTIQGRYDEAVEILSLGLHIAPTMPQWSIQLGYTHLSRSDCANAKAAFARALEISPDSHDALFGMAKAYQELGEAETAAVYFRRYLTDRPNDFGAWLNLGHCLLELGQPDPGYECFRRAARGDAGRYGAALTSLASAARGRFWLRPSEAARFLRASQ
jgi:tetratricopeptide (TPR) repeat protein